MHVPLEFFLALGPWGVLAWVLWSGLVRIEVSREKGPATWRVVVGRPPREGGE